MKFPAFLAALLATVTGALAADSVVVFNEIAYNPPAGQPEFIELRNLHGVDVLIGGWKIDGGVDFTIPAGTIVPGGGHVVIGAVPGSLGNFAGQLDNGGETLRLRNLNGRIMDEVSYDDEGEWAAGADGSGATLVRRAPDANEGPAAWTTSTTVGGTPGTQNFHEGASAVRTVNVAIGDSWKFEDSGAAAPAGWQNAGFDDGAWKSGPTLITGGGGKLARGVKPDALPNGLLAYWSFNETSGTTAVNSVTGQPNGTMANGATFVTDVIRGQVASFDGADDRMEVIDSGTGLPSVTFLPGFTATNDFTWAAWVLSTVATTDAGQSGSVILGNRTDPNGQDYTPREFIKIMPTAMQYHRQAATENLNYPDLIISAWTHICVVKRGQFLDYYRNGVFVQTLSISGGLSNPMPFFVGGDRMASVNEHFAGRVDDVALWTRALSATEIGQIGSEFGVTPPLPNPPEQTTAAVAGAQPRYFRKAFTFSGTPATATMELWPVADDGAVIYLNGAEVHRINVPPTTEVGDARFPSAPITIPSGALVAGPNVLSAEVHQFPGGNDDLLFGAQLAITAVPGPAPAAPPSLVFTEISGANDASFFIELRNTSSAAVDTAGWTLKTSSGQSVILPAQNVTAGGYFTIKAGALGFTPADGSKLFLLAPGANELRDSREVTNRLRGLLSNGAWGHPDSATPGAPNLATIASAVVINEIFYHAPGSSAEQWIELHNRTDADVSIAGWKFTDGVSYIFPVGTIVPANGFRVLAWDPAAFAALHSGVTALGPFGGSLSRKGESLTLRDANDNIVSQLTYSENGRWSQWADGGGSSLELRDRDADNRVAEAWDASDESLKTGWQTVSYGPLLGSHATTSSLAYWNEFILGLLDAGEVLVDDVSVTESGTQLIQNGTFDTGTATWRNVGNHQLTTVVDDPFAPGNKVMKIVATGATEHMSNHSETTLKAGGAFVALSNAKSYTISFRAKWLRGTNRLHSRLYFNRLPRQTLLPMVTTGGTPGAVNSRAVANAGPTFSSLAVTPVVPPAGQPATVRVRIADPDNVATAELFYSANGGAFASAGMTLNDGVFSADVPARSAGTLVQFYVRATDALGAQSFFPAAGPASRAMIPWADGKSIFTLPSGAKPHNIRVVLPTADTNDLYKAENVMSNHYRPCTVIYDDRVAYYHATARLKSSEHGRFQENRVGFNLRFSGEEPFLGAHETISVDRSGNQGTGGIDGNTVNSAREILIKSVMTAAGGIPAVEDDIVRLIAPVSNSGTSAFDGAEITGAALLSKSRFDDEYLDNQWPEGSAGMFKQEYVYPLSATIDPITRAVGTNPEHPKVPQTGGSPGPSGINVSGIYGTDKEAYRWHWLIRDSRTLDDYSPLLAAVTAVGQPQGSATFKTQTNATLDVNGWLRAVVVPQLFSVTDNYLANTSATHNFLLFFPVGGKGIAIPWDLDYLGQNDPNAPITNGGDLAKFIADPVNKRTYYSHVLDVLNRSFNTAHLTRWAQHYSRFGGDDMTTSLSFLNQRATAVRSMLTGAGGISQTPFNTTPSPLTLTVNTPFATVNGVGWIDIAEIRLQGSAEPLAVTWTGEKTWTLQLPVSAGTNDYMLVAYNNLGAQLGSASVTVTGTGGVFPAGPGNLVISEIHFNPPDAATEFVELLNLTSTTLDLGGCHFDEELSQGIAYTFPAGTQIPAGGRLLVVRDRAAFIAAYPTAGPLAPNQFSGALDNAGESLVLYAASGSEIFRVAFSDEIYLADGGGHSLVRVLGSTKPTPLPSIWRASVATGGNPSASDAVAFSGTALADADLDGLAALLEYALGTDEGTPTPDPWDVTRDALGNFIITFQRAIAADDAAVTIEAAPEVSGAWAPADATPVGSVLNGSLSTETWRVPPPVGSQPLFLRLRATRR